MADVKAGTNRLVGRDRELATLGSFLGEALVDGATLLLTGEPGVGKTALLVAAAEMAAADGVRVIRGGGVEYETDVSFAGLHQLVDPLSDDLRQFAYVLINGVLAYKERLESRFGGRHTDGDYGDPAGMQRNPSTGTSVITDLNTAGVPVGPVLKRPQDYSLRILNNMMAGSRVLVAKDASDLSHAFASHKWKLGPEGDKSAKDPVHDWTSHYVDAVRYPASVLLPFGPRRVEDQPEKEYAPNQYGHVFGQQLGEAGPDESRWIGSRKRRRATFEPGVITPRGA